MTKEQMIADCAWLGPMRQFHEIGGYCFVEYFPKNFNAPHSDPMQNPPCFCAYIDGGSTNRSYHSLEEALVGAIAHKYEGPNSPAGHYFLKSIDYFNN